MPSVNPTDVPIEIPAGQDVLIKATGNFDSTGYHFAFVVTDPDGVVLADKTDASGITVSQTTPTTVIYITLLRADTSEVTGSNAVPCRWALWRTDAGHYHKLAGGPFSIVATPEHEVV